jgi:hypothetical protein
MFTYDFTKKAEVIACVKFVKEYPFSFIISGVSVSVCVDYVRDFGLNVVVGNA